ncbi:caspase-10 [Phacochoerus africanus]|uniref:caspase-10 n=1 Tax=Phacochoerus africanus TaxID=41426 RepID=UPI001FDA9090|nr:caspase-10 [Phacochoerus africanus]XP_047629181.1 caspase-10 [Phacochoerus africanus]
MTAQGQSLSSDDYYQMGFRGKLLIIDSNLGDQDVERLKFLCRDHISSRSLERSNLAVDIFDQLMTEELLSEEDTFFLAELLYTIKQNSLLRHLNYTKEQVASLLPTRRKVSLFRNLLYELSEDISSDNLKGMTFLLRESIPRVQMTSLSLLSYLEKQDQIGEDNLTLLEDVCKKIAPNLMRKIEKYKREKASQVVTPPSAKETESLPQGKEELFSPSDIKHLLGSLQEGSQQDEHAGSNGETATPVSVELLGASVETLTSKSSTKETAVYRMDRNHRGFCVVVNNHRFTSLSERPGTHKDAECLKRVFEWLGFSVHVYVDVTKGRLMQVLREYQSHPGHADGDCFVFCVLTHGEFGAIYSSDGDLIPIREILSHFTAQQCPGLAHKPKLFFIQACQGEEVQPSVSIEADAVNPELKASLLKDSIPVEADFLLGLATVPGYVSFRHVKEGSWYIQSLYNHLKDLVPRHEDILSILTAVNNDVSRQVDKRGSKKQMPQPAFTLRKKVVFPVPQEELLL